MTLQPLSTIRESASSPSHIDTAGEEQQEVYSVMKISGEGMGVVANTAIPPGRLIIEEKPLLNVPLTPSGDLPGRVILDQPMQIKSLNLKKILFYIYSPIS